MPTHPIANQILNLLEQQNLWHEHFDHPPVRTSEQAAALRPGYNLEQGAKAIIIRIKIPVAGKKFVMLVVPADRKIDNSKVKNIYKAKEMRFAAPDEIESITEGVKPGGIPPFGNLFGLEVICDSSLSLHHEIIFNASRTTSIAMRSKDYVTLVNPKLDDITTT